MTETLFRMLDYLPDFYNKEDGSINYEFLLSVATEIDVLSSQADNLQIEIQIDTSTGNYLNDLARLFRLSRKPSETDIQFRARIKAYWPGFSGGGTIESIKATLNRITEVPESDITVTEIDFMKIAVDVILDSEEDYSLVSTIESTLQIIKAAGIAVFRNYTLTSGPFNEGILCSDSIEISTTPISGYWVAGISSAGGIDVA